MFKSVVRFIPTVGSRFASTMASRAVVTPSPTQMISQFKQKVQFASASHTQVGLMQQTCKKIEPVSKAGITEMIMTSVLRKRRLKMKKHKLRKRRKAQRALRIKIGK